jgi:hypothetical protein
VARGLVHWLYTVRVPAVRLSTAQIPAGRDRCASAGQRRRPAAGTRGTADAAAGGSAGASGRYRAGTSPDDGAAYDAVNETTVNVRRLYEWRGDSTPTEVYHKRGESAPRRVPALLSLAAAALLGVLGYLA